MNRRKLLLAGGSSLSVILAGCSGDTDDGDGGNGNDNGESGDDDGGNENGDDSESEDDDSESQDDEEETDNEPDYGNLETHEFSGSGDSVESGIELEEGLITIDATHDGDSNFAVHLVDDDRDHLFVNEIGTYEGETADNLDFDEYEISVETDGNWEIEIRQPYANRGYDLPVEESCEGDTVIGPYEFDGTHTLTADHDGESNFAVHIYPEMGNPELLVNEVGEYEGESSVRFDEPGWIAIEADGNWTIEIE